MKLFRKLGSYFLPEMRQCYAQFGEDEIISYFFSQIGIKKPSYLDIGANEPRSISNTYYFYLRRCKGVLIEPNPHLYRKLKRLRPRDIILNAGVGFNEQREGDFYVFPDNASGLSTFSKEEAMHWETIGVKGLGKIPVEKVIKMPLVPVNEILNEYFSDSAPNFVSVDVEGLDLEILKSIDFGKFRPELFCVETLSYDPDQNTYKRTEINEFLASVGYKVHADTYVNTIFIRQDLRI